MYYYAWLSFMAKLAIGHWPWIMAMDNGLNPIDDVDTQFVT